MRSVMTWWMLTRMLLKACRSCSPSSLSSLNRLSCCCRYSIACTKKRACSASAYHDQHHCQHHHQQCSGPSYDLKCNRLACCSGAVSVSTHLLNIQRQAASSFLDGQGCLVRDYLQVQADAHVLAHLCHVEGLQHHVGVAWQLLNGLQALLCRQELHILACMQHSKRVTRMQDARATFSNVCCASRHFTCSCDSSQQQVM